MTRLLELEHVSQSFGSVLVIDDLTFGLEEGEALGVVGPNGAGKTTLMNLVAGTVPLDSGHILFEGRDVSQMSPHARCRAGVGRTHQIPQPFEQLTVFENVLVGVRFGRPERAAFPYAAAMEQVDRVSLTGKVNALAGSLTLMERKRLELARGLATEPKLLLLDEIAGGLTDAEVEQLIATIESLRRDGISIVWIEHIVHALVSVVDRLIAIDFGRLLLEGPPHDVIADPKVQEVYMGVEES